MMGKNLIPGKKSPRRRSYLCLLIPFAFLQILIVLLFRHISNLSRFSAPSWTHPLPVQQPADPSSALITQIPEELPDGLGHRLAVVNFELLLARSLSVRYIHRFALYDSLTRHDPKAVDKLFGWDVITDTRRRLLKENCVVERRVTSNCPWRGEYPFCKSLKRGAKFDRLVNIPNSKVDCMREKGSTCWRDMKSWGAQYGRRTLFQMKGGFCHEKYILGNFLQTRPWLRNMYWNRVSSLGIRSSLDPKRFQIGVHIRRGDFLNETDRVLIPDAVFVDLVCGVKNGVDGLLDGDVPTDVHIFSEGVPKKGYIWRHDIDLMEKSYVTDVGDAVDGLSHWTRLIRGRCKGDVVVHAHIASDTITAIRDMIAADVFIGSKSGLSVHVVDVLSRGVRIVPVWRGAVRMNGEWGMKYDLVNNSASVDWMEFERCLVEMKKDGALAGIELRR